MTQNLLSPNSHTALVADPFSHRQYTVRRPLFSPVDRTFRIFAPDGRLVMFVRNPILQLRDGFTVWADEDRSQELLRVKQRSLMEKDATYEVEDLRNGAPVGALRRRLLRSLLRDTFDILDPTGKEIGRIEEKGNSLLRRLIPVLPSRHEIEVGGRSAGGIRQVFRFFIKEFRLDLPEGDPRLDPRLAIAGALLALMAEVNRES